MGPASSKRRFSIFQHFCWHQAIWKFLGRNFTYCLTAGHFRQFTVYLSDSEEPSLDIKKASSCPKACQLGFLTTEVAGVGLLLPWLSPAYPVPTQTSMSLSFWKQTAEEAISKKKEKKRRKTSTSFYLRSMMQRFQQAQHFHSSASFLS